VTDRQVIQREIPASTLAAARNGDQRAFAALVEHYDSRLRALAYHLLGDPHQTDDALQDVYMKVYRGLPAFAGDAALSTWLTRITYTTCIDHLRRGRRLVPTRDLEPESPPPEGPDPTDDLSSRSTVRDALRRLPLEQRAVVVLVGVQGLDYRQASEILGVPSGTVASRLSSARKTLRRSLREDDEPLAVTGRIEEVPS
jgi:RNA polymerase sigma-70 factor, ECF subfamily